LSELPSFPTRRSSDLKGRSRNVPRRILLITEYTGYRNIRSGQLLLGGRAARAPRTCLLMDMEWLRSGLLHAMANSASLALVPPRSEEHTSELQSRVDL